MENNPETINMPSEMTPAYFQPMYAHAYVPFQTLTCVYPPMEGLKHWTIFPELDMPMKTESDNMMD